MNARTQCDRLFRFHSVVPWSASASVLLLALSFASSTSVSQTRERQGKEVVDAVCASCHASGATKVDANVAKDAPKIGDAAAWAKRASQGLTSLTEHAIKGIRNMPAHGGSAGTSDVEIERAITYMVNQSGGHWIEPVGGAAPAVLRSSEQIVRTQCSKCHEPGLDGAPKIGDRAAWIPRLKNGMETLVASAIHGHGAMPARGGLPDLNDAEIRGAIGYMFNYGVVLPQAAAPTRTAINDPYHKLVAGTEIYLGVMPAQRIRAASSKDNSMGVMHGGVPKGDNYYHINISLADSKTKALISDAAVTVKVSNAVGAETKPLELMVEYNAISYGGYFRMDRGTAYSITALVRRPDMPDAIEARFDFKPQ